MQPTRFLLPTSRAQTGTDQPLALLTVEREWRVRPETVGGTLLSGALWGPLISTLCSP